MSCDWGGGWHEFPYFLGGLAALLILVCLLGVAAVIYCHIRRNPFAQPQCPACGGAVEEVFLRCPFCGAHLKRHCSTCHRIIASDLRLCPFCHSATGREGPGTTENSGDAPFSINTGKKG